MSKGVITIYKYNYLNYFINKKLKYFLQLIINIIDCKNEY